MFCFAQHRIWLLLDGPLRSEFGQHFMGYLKQSLGFGATILVFGFLCFSFWIGTEPMVKILNIHYGSVGFTPCQTDVVDWPASHLDSRRFFVSHVLSWCVMKIMICYKIYDICLFIFFHVSVLVPKLFSFQGDFRFVLCCLPFEIAMFLSLHFLMAPPHEAWLKPWSQKHKNASELQKVSAQPRRTKSNRRVRCQAYGAFHHHSMRSLLCFNNVVLVRLFSNASIYCSWQGR